MRAAVAAAAVLFISGISYADEDLSTCSAMERETKVDQYNGTAWYDLASCLKKHGLEREATTATHEAAMVGDKAVRLKSYKLLHTLKVILRVDDLDPATVSSKSVSPAIWDFWSDTCGGVAVSIRSVEGGGSGAWSKGTTVTFCKGVRPAQMARLDWTSEAGWAARRKFHCKDLELYGESKSFCRPGDVGGAGCGACGCEKAPVPADCEASVARCRAHPNTAEEAKCTFVFADACRERVGAVCNGEPEEFWLDESLHL